MFATGNRAVLLLLLVTGSCSAVDAPAIYQAMPNFSNAIADHGFSITWTATPIELDPDTDVFLTIRFSGIVNPERVRRPDLAGRQAFQELFRQIESVEDSPATPSTKTVAFRYKLRPRNERVQAIPELAVAYYSPGSGGVATKYLDAIALTIRPVTTPDHPSQPFEAPQRLLTLPDSASGSQLPSDWHWLVLVVLLVAGSLIWVAVWRHRHPDGVRLAQLRRNRAVRRAFDSLDRAARSPDPAAAARRSIHDYLADRFGVSAATPTPNDIAAAMREANLPPDRIEHAVELVWDCDAVRFGGAREDGSLVERVRSLILHWESDA